MLTVVYVLILVGVTVLGPMFSLLWIVLLAQPGIAGAIGYPIGLKEWAVYPSVIVLGVIGITRAKYIQPTPRRKAIFVVGGGGLYILAVGTVLNGNPTGALFDAIVHGGLLAAFIMLHMRNSNIWRIIWFGLCALLTISALAHWGGPISSLAARFNGLEYIAQVEDAGAFVQVGNVNDRMSRGGGVYSNPNCWAQVGALAFVIGLCALLFSGGRVRLGGTILFVLGLTGLLGALSRSALVAALVGSFLALGIRFIGKNRNLRVLLIVLGLAIPLLFSVWANALDTLEGEGGLRSLDGFEYRMEQLNGVASSLQTYIIRGSQDRLSDTAYNPHDILLSYIYLFGFIPAVTVLLALYGGTRLTWRWIAGGRSLLVSEFELDRKSLWIADAAIPIFSVFCVCGLGNGLAGGMPYTQLFILFSCFAFPGGANLGRVARTDMNRTRMSVLHAIPRAQP